MGFTASSIATILITNYTPICCLDFLELYTPFQSNMCVISLQNPDIVLKQFYFIFLRGNACRADEEPRGAIRCIQQKV